MSENEKVTGLINAATDKLRGMVDSDTVIGQPIPVGEITLIPVSKASFGVAAGGSDLPSKQPGSYFAGGSGAGATVTPVAFLAVKDGDVRLLQIYKDDSASGRAIGLLPELFDRVTDLFKKNNGNNQE
ncbi:MAG: GerW family sporulation protein [Candidatus Howiella sp.]|jgi:sporulation protein YtfJ